MVFARRVCSNLLLFVKGISENTNGKQDIASNDLADESAENGKALFSGLAVVPLIRHGQCTP